MRRCVLAVVLAATGVAVSGSSSAAPSLPGPGMAEVASVFVATPADRIVDVASVPLVDAPVSRVPEPGVYAMVFAGLAVIVWKVRRHRRR